MEAGTCHRCALVGILFAYPLRLDDRESQLRNRGSAVFCHFRCSARWIRIEGNLYKTAFDRSYCDGLRHFFDCIPIVHQQTGSFRVAAIGSLTEGDPQFDAPFGMIVHLYVGFD